MKKRIFQCLIPVLALLLIFSGCRKKPAETTAPSDEADSTTQSTAESTPGLIENDFDWDEVEENTESTEDDEDATIPTQGKEDDNESTIPTESNRPGSNNNPPESGGLQDPEDPEEPNDSAPTNPGTQKPDPTDPNPTEKPDVSPDDVDYETFMAMSPSEQQAFMESFDSIEDFFVWFQEAKQKYEDEHPSVDVGDGNVTIPG